MSGGDTQEPVFHIYCKIMREINGYRIVNIDMGLGGVSHPIFIKEHSKK